MQQRSSRKMKHYALHPTKSSCRAVVHTGEGRVYRTWEAAKTYMDECRKRGVTMQVKKFQHEEDAQHFVEHGYPCAKTANARQKVMPSALHNGVLTVYTDGSAMHGRAGCGVFFDTDSPLNVSARLRVPPFTNNRAELHAIELALQTIVRNYFGDDEGDNNRVQRVIVRSDSSYSIAAITTWRQAWQQSNFKNNSIANRDLIETLWALHDQFPCSVEFAWTSAHSGVYGNERADELAKAAARDNDK